MSCDFRHSVRLTPLPATSLWPFGLLKSGIETWNASALTGNSFELHININRSHDSQTEMPQLRHRANPNQSGSFRNGCDDTPNAALPGGSVWPNHFAQNHSMSESRFETAQYRDQSNWVKTSCDGCFSSISA
jgi:hypothetical protein